MVELSYLLIDFTYLVKLVQIVEPFKKLVYLSAFMSVRDVSILLTEIEMHQKFSKNMHGWLNRV